MNWVLFHTKDYWGRVCSSYHFDRTVGMLNAWIRQIHAYDSLLVVQGMICPVAVYQGDYRVMLFDRPIRGAMVLTTGSMDGTELNFMDQLLSSEIPDIIYYVTPKGYCVHVSHMGCLCDRHVVDYHGNRCVVRANNDVNETLLHYYRMYWGG